MQWRTRSPDSPSPSLHLHGGAGVAGGGASTPAGFHLYDVKGEGGAEGAGGRRCRVYLLLQVATVYMLNSFATLALDKRTVMEGEALGREGWGEEGRDSWLPSPVLSDDGAARPDRSEGGARCKEATYTERSEGSGGKNHWWS